MMEVTSEPRFGPLGECVPASSREYITCLTATTEMMFADIGSSPPLTLMVRGTTTFHLDVHATGQMAVDGNGVAYTPVSA